MDKCIWKHKWKLLFGGKILVEIKLLNRINWWMGNKIKMGVLMVNWKFK